MGWSRHSIARRSEAHARSAALGRIGYVGDVDADGYPLEGLARTTNERAPFHLPRRDWWDDFGRSNLAADAYEDAVYGGGTQHDKLAEFMGDDD